MGTLLNSGNKFSKYNKIKEQTTYNKNLSGRVNIERFNLYFH